MPYLPGDNIHLRDTVRIQRQDSDGIRYGGSALGPVKVLPGGAIVPTDISELYPGVDLTPAVEAAGCFNSRWGDCTGKVANCPTLETMVLCEHHHRLVHGEEYPAEKGSFKCWPPTKTS